MTRLLHALEPVHRIYLPAFGQLRLDMQMRHVLFDLAQQ